MVGPRPSELSLSGNEIIKYARTVVKPGITGLWQIKNRHNSTINDMITYDIEYIENLNFYNDINIMLRTIPAVIFCEGAF